MGRWSAQSSDDYYAEQDWPKLAECGRCGHRFAATPGATVLCDTCWGEAQRIQEQKSIDAERQKTRGAA